MVRDHINQNLRCGADSLPLFHGLIDQWLGFDVQAVCLFDDRLCLIEKIDQRPGPWQRFLNLLKLCFAETGRVPDEFNKPVFQHSLTLLVATAIYTEVRQPIPSGGTRLGPYVEVRWCASLS
jgi:hypothetical protein